MTAENPAAAGSRSSAWPVVQHIKGMAVEGDHFRSRQVGARTAHIDVAADGCDRGEVAQRIQDRRVADVAGMQDVLDAAQGFDCLRPEQAMGIGNNADPDCAAS